MHIEWLWMFCFITSCQTHVLKRSNNQQNADGSSSIEIHMPGVHPDQDDEYWCYAYHVSQGAKYITQFEALAKGDVAHHILVYGCGAPAAYGKAWKCGSLCSQGTSKILFAWARNAPPTHMPQDVGYEIGGPSGVNYIILQIHYRHGFTANDPPDKSGMKITTTESPPKYMAGVMIMLATHLTIPAHAPKVSANMSCQYNGKTSMHPFAFRTHAHSLATVISGYHYNGTWDMLGKGNPQWPQAFYPMDHQHTVKPGDYLVAQCTYDATNSDKTTYIGGTHNDEMCNYYMMYYTDNTQGESFLECYDDDFPKLSKNKPAGSDEPPPPNPVLDDIAEGHHHHHHDDTDEESNVMPLQAIHVVEGWPMIKASDKVTLGQVGGIAVDNKENVHVFHRGSRIWNDRSFTRGNIFNGAPLTVNTLLTFDAAGNIIDQWGKNMFYMPHGLFIDHNENLWLTDVAMHQVMRFPPGKHTPDLVLGEKLKPGNDKTHFCKPADLTVLESGEFFVADGYCNSRIVKFSKDGKYIKEWGTPSSTVLADHYPPNSTFVVPHSIVNIAKHKQLCVADRQNGRIQCFDYEGNFIKQIHFNEFGGQLYAITYCPDLDVLYAVNGEDLYKKPVKVQGFTIDYNKNTLLEAWGPKEGFTRPHDITVANDGKDLYVSEIGPNKVWKFQVDTEKVNSVQSPTTSIALSTNQSLPTTPIVLYSNNNTQTNIQSYPSSHDVKPSHPNTQSYPSSHDLHTYPTIQVPAAITEQVSHQAVKGPGTHPESVDSSSDEITETKIEKSEEPDFGVSIVIGALLIIPVLVIIIIVVFLRVRKRSTLPDGYKLVMPDEDDYDDEDDLWVKSQMSTGKKVSFQSRPLIQQNGATKHISVWRPIKDVKFSVFSLSDYNQKNRRFNLGEFFGRRHKGFDPLSTDDNGELDHLNSDSDEVEEYSATSSHKA